MPPVKPEQKPLQAVEQITPQQLEFKLKDILEEYLKDCCTVAKCDKDIRECIPASSFSQLRSLGYDKIVEESTRARIRTATLLAQFIRMNMLPLETYCAGLDNTLAQVDDLTVESPKIWEHLAEMVAPLIYENALPLETLHASCQILISQGNAGKFLGPILKLVVRKKGPKYLASLWHSSELILEEFLPTADVSKFITDNQLEFLLDGLRTFNSKSTLTFKQIHQKLLDFFENKTSFDDVSNWITVNVGDRVKDKQFIHVLAMAAFENSIVRLQLNDKTLRKHYKILLMYIDGNLHYEVQLLYALQAHINKLGNPQGLLLQVFTVLYDDSMLSHDSIIFWECNKDPAEQNVIDRGSPYNTTGKNVFDKKNSHEDVVLHKCKNPWQPARFTGNVATTEDEKTEHLYKKFRCILNKLTPQTFDKLLHQINSLTIDTEERLQGIADLVHKQAVNDPIFSVGYAVICSRLALMQVSTKKDGESVNFRKLLITRCQKEFENKSINKTSRNNEIKEIETCTDPEKKKEMQLILEENHRQYRRKSVGNVKFIGELFKKKMLAVDTIMTCLDKLLNNKDNESLECLGALLSTVGEELEKREVSLEHIFDSIKEIVGCKRGKIGNRVRFILQDVIELRSAKWVPRHQDSNGNKADDEQLNNLAIEQRNKYNNNNVQTTLQSSIFQMQSTAPYMQAQPVHPMYSMPFYGSTQWPMVQPLYQGLYPTALRYPQAPPPAQGFRWLIPQATPVRAANINQNPQPQVAQNFYQGQALLQGQGFHYYIPRPQAPVSSIPQPRVQPQPSQFLVDGRTTTTCQTALSFEEINKTLLHFFNYQNYVDDIYNWINVNVGDRVKDKQFIRVLATAVLENSIIQSKFNTAVLRKHYKLLLKYIDGNLEYELQLLYAVQAHINKLQNSKGLLLDVFTMLYDDSIVSQDSFVRWKCSKDPTEREGKRVALKQLTSFFMSLKAVDEESSSSEDF